MQVIYPTQFPTQLAHMPDPPDSLYCAGTPPQQDRCMLTVVGSRACSDYGTTMCESLITHLAGTHVTIVSGLAIGIDTVAHQAALAAGLPTIAFPGSGLAQQVLYPKQNIKLAQEICTSGGCLLSEFAPHTRPRRWTFPKRNRLMAGIAHVVLVIEAAAQSGTLITARLATEYNRDVCAIPGDATRPTAIGTNALLADGAIPVTCPDDLLQALATIDVFAKQDDLL